MSIYVPRREALSIVKRDDGWWIDDNHGSFDGPYQTVGDARAVAERISIQDSGEGVVT